LWLEDPGIQHAQAREAMPNSVQRTEAMRAQAGAGMAAQQALAARIYRRWVQGLPR
jgi:hypothetical protein